MKACLLICNKNAVSGKDTFPFIKDKILTIGYTIPKDYDQPPEDEPKSLQGLTRWITTLATPDKPPLILTKRYEAQRYPRYDNYSTAADFIGVSSSTIKNRIDNNSLKQVKSYVVSKETLN